MHFKKLLEVLTVYTYNMKVIHWNSIGEAFDRIHELADKYHNMINGTIDSIGEIMGMVDTTIPSFIDIFEDIKSLDKDYIVIKGDTMYDLESGISIIQNCLKDIVELIDECCEDTQIPVGIRSELESIQFEYSKELLYFNKRRVVESESDRDSFSYDDEEENYNDEESYDD